MKQIAIALAALSIVASQAQAQNAGKKATHTPRNEGFMLGATTVLAMGVTIQGPGIRTPISTNTGQGAGVQVGYGFSPRLMAFVSADVVKQGSNYGAFSGSFGLTHLQAGGRMTFPQANKRAVPYVSAYIGTHALAARSDEGGISATLRISGSEMGVGGGVLYGLSPSMSLDAGVNAGRGKFGNLVLSGDANSRGTVNVDNSTSIRLKVGFNWHP